MNIEKPESPNKEAKELLRVFNFSSVNLPQYEERINKQHHWIDRGTDNLFPQYLISLSTRSATHGAILKTKSQMIAGNGWNKTGLSAEASLFIRNVFNEFDLDEIAARCSYDLELSGGFFLNIIWSKDRTKIAEINYIDQSKVRIAIPDQDDPEETYYYVCNDYSNIRADRPENQPVLYPGYSYVNRKQASQILYVKEYTPGFEYYSLPSYLGGINNMELEWEISKFFLQNIRNGFHPSLMINFPGGEPNPEMMELVIRRLRTEYEGSTNAGKVMFTFSDGKDFAPTITPIVPNNNDNGMINISNDAESGILKAHRVNDPVLFGVKTPGELGGSNQIIESLSAFQAMYVDAKQNIIEKIFCKLAKVNGITDELRLEKYKLKLEIKIQPTDILAILQSSLPDYQKRQVFVSLGYTDDQATNLTSVENGYLSYLPVRVTASDLLTIITNPSLSIDQKIQILIGLGWGEEQAKLMVSIPQNNPTS